MRFWRYVCLFVVLGVCAVRCPGDYGANEPEPLGFWTKTLWYIPNRVLDFVDMFRLKIAVGPGLEAGARITDPFTVYAGSSRTVYVGLPGERAPGEWPSILGATQKTGLVLLGADASDLHPDPPRYEFSEIGVQFHLGAVGMEAGVVPSEALDFLHGILGRDRSGDDLPRRQPRIPRSPGRVLRPEFEGASYPLDIQPDSFSSLGERLDYLQKNVPVRMQGYMHHLDRAFLEDHHHVEAQPPVRDLEVSLWYEFISGPDGSHDLDAKLKIDVELPNLERNLSLFIDSNYNDALPGEDQVNIDDSGVAVGLRRQMEQYDLSADVGIHSGIPPELFTRLSWRPGWEWGETTMGFEQRFFWENEDGFGTLSQLHAYRWLGDAHHWLFRNLSAARFSESTTGMEWQQTFTLGHMTHLVEENRRESNVGLRDALQCHGWKASVFGNDRLLETYRATMIFRRPLYGNFVLLEFEPGLEWRNEHDWTTQYRFDLGVILLF